MLERGAWLYFVPQAAAAEPVAPHACSRECARNVMPRLPVLTAANLHLHPGWAEYLRAVYKQQPFTGGNAEQGEGETLARASSEVDLNTFSLFYRGHAVIDQLFSGAIDPCLQVCSIRSWPDRLPAYDGTVFVGDSGPELGVASFGFFVWRPKITRADAQTCDVLEVMHVRTDWLGGEVGVSWFFHAAGSGVFLDCRRLPTSGGIEVYKDRQEWRERHGGAEWVLDDHILGAMERDNAAMYIFTSAGFTVFNQAGNNPSTEIVMERLERAFRTHGLLVKTTTCHDRFCNKETEANSWAWINNALLSTSLPPPVENDCGPWCSAFSFLNQDLPVATFSFNGYQSGIALVFEAADDFWDRAACAATSDSSSSTRGCCACAEERYCPFEDFPTEDSGYCGVPCASDDKTCQQLAAGCGVSVFDLANLNWGYQSCARETIESGACALCTQPTWCDDGDNAFGYASAIKNASLWMERFYNQDGGRALGNRQCKWKPSQKDIFIDSMRMRLRRRKDEDDGYDQMNTWNEVNFYVGEGDGGLADVAWRHLIGLFYIRSSGTETDLVYVQRLAEHWAALGRDVPVFAVDAEPMRYTGDTKKSLIEYWSHNTRVALREPPYNLERIR